MASLKKTKTAKPVNAKTVRKPTPQARPAVKVKPAPARSVPQSPPASAAGGEHADAGADKRRPLGRRASDTALQDLKADVAALRAVLAGQAEADPTGPDAEVDALRRTVNDLLERRLESVVRDLVALRNTAAGLTGTEAVLTAADALLARLGAVRYDAQRLDHADPLIHAISRETREADLPEGVISASLRSGFRTARGVVLAKALVAVNRRT